MFPGLLFCLSKGVKGPQLACQAFSSQDPCPKRIRKNSLLKPNCKLNAKCCINLKISIHSYALGTMDANVLESCQSEIPFESQSSHTGLSLYSYPDMNHGQLDTQSFQQKSYALIVVYLLFVSLVILH